MKRSLFAVFILLAPFMFLNAQKRENKVYQTFDSKSEKLFKAIGWDFNRSIDKWIDHPNVISRYEMPLSETTISHEAQNFKWIRFASITIDDKKYKVLIYEKLSGRYKYPTIREDWNSENVTNFFVISEDQFHKIVIEISKKSGKSISVKSKMYGSISDRYKILGGQYSYNDEMLLIEISESIKNPGYLEKCLIFNSQTVDGVDIVRFLLPEINYSLRDMEYRYFEVETNNFNVILN